MTVEEIERILQTIAGNQAQLTEAQIGYGARQARLDETVKQLTEAQIGNEARQAKLDEVVKQIAEAHISLIELVGIQEERLDGNDVTLRAADEKLNALVDAQVGLEVRQAKLEESYQLLVQLARIQEERIDGHDVALRATDEKLNALIDAQVGLEARQAKLEESYLLLVQLARIREERIDGHDEALRNTNGKLDALIDAQIQLTQRVDTLNGRVDAIGEHLNQAVKQIIALASAQARTDKQIKMLLDRYGATKPGRGATKPAKKKATKKGPRS